jgi:hypothetical protein
MLIVFWGIHEIAHYCWLLKDSTLDLSLFVKKCFIHSLRKRSQIPQNSQTLDFDSYKQCKGSRGKGDRSEIRCFPIQMHAAATAYSEYCAIQLFPFGWLKTQLERREHNGEDELYVVVDEILIGLSIEMIETVFVDWMNRLQRLIAGNGDCVS